MVQGLDFTGDQALTNFMVGSARRLGTPGKTLLPIPKRRLSTRLYHMDCETLLVGGRSDRLILPLYAMRWQELVAQARLVGIDAADHMVPHERPAEAAEALVDFLNG